MQRAAVTQLDLALAVHLGPGPATTSLAEQLERAVRQKTAGLVGASYRKRARKLVFALKVTRLAVSWAGEAGHAVLHCAGERGGVFPAAGRQPRSSRPAVPPPGYPTAPYSSC